MIKVLDEKGREIDFEAAVMLTDEDLREEMHYEEKFGESFAPYVGGAW